MTSRRDFLHSTLAVLAAGCAGVPRAGGAGGRLPLGFSTLGCPNWSWREVLEFAARHGVPALELRGLQGTLDITQHPELAPTRLAESKRQLVDRELTVVCLGSSARMHELDPGTRAAQLDEARRYIDLAHALGAPYVRVFGDRYPTGMAREAARARIAATLREVGEHARDKGVTVLIESHGDFTDSPSLLEILQQADSPAVALLWDARRLRIPLGSWDDGCAIRT